MNVSVRTHSAGFPVFSVSSEDNEFELSAFGGQLISWISGGVPILFSNRDHAVDDGKAPFRGGAPICFPHFGKGALMPGAPVLLPQHGGARTSIWDFEVRESSVVFRTEQPSPEGFGPTIFACEIAYFFSAGVRIETRVRNIGENESPFQLAIHSYWACENPSAATVTGLGERYLDNLAGYQEAFDNEPSGPHTPPFDRVYPDSADDLELATGDYRVSISSQGGAGAVLWNPGRDHSIGDLGSPDFVCVENGIITPARVLGAGEEHLFVLTYEVSTLSNGLVG